MLHTYKTIPSTPPGNMWAQTWTHILDLTVPYPGRPSVDVTNTLRRQGYSPFDMFRLSESFFISLGLEPMPSTFWQKSLLIKPTDRDVICHASAWDFCNGIDYRLVTCVVVFSFLFSLFLLLFIPLYSFLFICLFISSMCFWLRWRRGDLFRICSS